MRTLTLAWARRDGWSLTARARRGRLAWIVVLSTALLGLLQAPAGAATNPYTGPGYDASYPSSQCGATSYPDGFAILGLGGGRPFTLNSCLAHEWSLAAQNAAATSGNPATPSLYFNTGYAGAYARDITAACQNAVTNAPIPAGTPAHQKSTEQQAWEIGCSEAAYAAVHAPAEPAMWWADIETGNSWSTSTTYNDFAIDGIAYGMSTLTTTTGMTGGIYSTPGMWNKIAGSGFVSTPAITADWQPAPGCPVSGFSLLPGGGNSPVWVIQTGTVAGFGADQGC